MKWAEVSEKPSIRGLLRWFGVMPMCALLFSPSASFAATPMKYAQGSKASVLIFITPECPVANALMPEVAKLWDQFGSQGTAFTLVYADPATTLQEARAHAQQYGLKTIPLLVDSSHQLVRQFKAQRTPEAFLLGKDGRVLYHGRINDLYHAPGRRKREPHSHDLRDAIDAVLANRKPPSEYQPAVGCVIEDFGK